MMDKKQTLEMIAAISNANGAPGFEDGVVDAILPYAKELFFYIFLLLRKGRAKSVPSKGNNNFFCIHMIKPNITSVITAHTLVNY